MTLSEKIKEWFEGRGRSYTPSDVASEIGHPAPSVRRTLNALVDEGVLTKDKTPSRGMVYQVVFDALGPKPEPGPGERVCPRCHETKVIKSDFGLRNGKPQSWCYTCRREDAAAKRAARANMLGSK